MHVGVDDIFIVLSLLAVFPAIGITLDRLTLPRQAERLREPLERFWVRIDDTRIADIPAAGVRLYIKGERRLLGESFSFTWLCRTAFISVVLTTFAMTIVSGIIYSIAVLFISPGAFTESLADNVKSNVEINFNSGILTVALVNMVFDQATVAVTKFALRAYIRHVASFIRSEWIILDIAACVLIYDVAPRCVNMADYLSETELPFVYGSSILGMRDFASDLPLLFIHYGPCLAVTSTVTIPTILYLSIILILTVSKFSLHLGRLSSLQILEVSASGDKSPFFYLGTAIGLVASVGKLVEALPF